MDSVPQLSMPPPKKAELKAMVESEIDSVLPLAIAAAGPT